MLHFCHINQHLSVTGIAGKMLLNPLHPNISMHILYTVFYTNLMVLTWKICLSINKIFSWWSFPLFSWPYCVAQGLYRWEKLGTSHSQCRCQMTIGLGWFVFLNNFICSCYSKLLNSTCFLSHTWARGPWQRANLSIHIATQKNKWINVQEVGGTSPPLVKTLRVKELKA